MDMNPTHETKTSATRTVTTAHAWARSTRRPPDGVAPI